MATDKHGASALHVAAQGDNIDAIELLTKYGATINMKDKKGSFSIIEKIKFI